MNREIINSNHYLFSYLRNCQKYLFGFNNVRISAFKRILHLSFSIFTKMIVLILFFRNISLEFIFF